MQKYFMYKDVHCTVTYRNQEWEICTFNTRGEPTMVHPEVSHL